MTAMVTAVVGSAVIGGLVSNQASKRAASAQENAADRAAQVEWDMYQQNREDMEPWRDSGELALQQIRYGIKPGGVYNRDFGINDFEKDPGYQFRMDEGIRGIESSAAARGGVLSGANLKDVTRFGSDYASGEYTNAYNRWNADRDRRFGRLSQLAGIGQTAATQVANQGSQTAGRVGDYMTQAGNARASGYVGTANAINQGIGTIGNFFQSQYQQPQQQSAQQWWSSGAPASGSGAGFGTPGLNSFFLGNGTGAD